MTKHKLKTTVLNATYVLCRCRQTDNALERQVEKHVVGLLLVYRKLHCQLVVEEAGINTKLIVGNGSPLKLVVDKAALVSCRIQCVAEHV